MRRDVPRRLPAGAPVVALLPGELLWRPCALLGFAHGGHLAIVYPEPASPIARSVLGLGGSASSAAYDSASLNHILVNGADACGDVISRVANAGPAEQQQISLPLDAVLPNVWADSSDSFSDSEPNSESESEVAAPLQHQRSDRNGGNLLSYDYGSAEAQAELLNESGSAELGRSEGNGECGYVRSGHCPDAGHPSL